MVAEQDPSLRRHQGEVAESAAAVGARFGMTDAELGELVLAAELHDVGKIALPRSILDKPAGLDDQEWRVMRRHTVIGESMLAPFADLRRVASFVRSSHERFDGRGYPDGLAGEAIPLASRIVFVCDSYDAMVAGRPYRAPRPTAEALAELQAGAGSQFDPAVVTAFRISRFV
jgi:HD-GYP domain-containing protein (c-di-GMP phosphodiesterase class II)